MHLYEVIIPGMTRFLPTIVGMLFPLLLGCPNSCPNSCASCVSPILPRHTSEGAGFATCVEG